MAFWDWTIYSRRAPYRLRQISRRTPHVLRQIWQSKIDSLGVVMIIGRGNGELGKLLHMCSSRILWLLSDTMPQLVSGRRSRWCAPSCKRKMFERNQDVAGFEVEKKITNYILSLVNLRKNWSPLRIPDLCNIIGVSFIKRLFLSNILYLHRLRSLQSICASTSFLV